MMIESTRTHSNSQTKHVHRHLLTPTDRQLNSISTVYFRQRDFNWKTSSSWFICCLSHSSVMLWLHYAHKQIDTKLSGIRCFDRSNESYQHNFENAAILNHYLTSLNSLSPSIFNRSVTLCFYHFPLSRTAVPLFIS